MGRPRTVNAKIKDMPRGMRKVGQWWYWRPTDVATRAVFDVLAKRGHVGNVGKTPNEAKAWWSENVSPLLHQMTPEEAIKGTVEEIIRAYVADELPTLKKEATKGEYETHIKRLRADFGHLRYPRTEQEALLPGYLRDVAIQKHLHTSRSKPYIANRRVSLLSRMFRLAKVRWGLTAYNPCADIEYLPEHARDVYADDKDYIKVVDAGAELFQVMVDISQQTSARIGSVYTIGLDQITEQGLVIRVGKKKNAKGYSEVLYKWTDDLKATIAKARVLREKVPGTPEKKDPAGPLFLNRFGKAYTQEAYKSAWGRVRKKLGLKAREITVHDLGRAKAVSEAESDLEGQALAGHESVGVTKRHYRRKMATVQPAPAVKRKTK